MIFLFLFDCLDVFLFSFLRDLKSGNEFFNIQIQTHGEKGFNSFNEMGTLKIF